MPSTTNTEEKRTAKACNRSWGIEAIGLFSAAAFFVGVFFAYRTYAAGVVTQGEFESLRSGLSLADANSSLDMKGRRVESNDPNEVTEVYRWENSTLSYVECEFVNGQLVSKKAVELPH